MPPAPQKAANRRQRNAARRQPRQMKPCLGTCRRPHVAGHRRRDLEPGRQLGRGHQRRRKHTRRNPHSVPAPPLPKLPGRVADQRQPNEFAHVRGLPSGPAGINSERPADRKPQTADSGSAVASVSQPPVHAAPPASRSVHGRCIARSRARGRPEEGRRARERDRASGPRRHRHQGRPFHDAARLRRHRIARHAPRGA